MSFIKKNWKRGDKLNVKELNRIEDGIEQLETSIGSESASANNNLDTVEITCNLAVSEASGVLTVSNLSLSSYEIGDLILQNKNVVIKALFNSNTIILRLSSFKSYVYENNTYLWVASFIGNFIQSSDLEIIKFEIYDNSQEPEGYGTDEVACHIYTK